MSYFQSFLFKRVASCDQLERISAVSQTDNIKYQYSPNRFMNVVNDVYKRFGHNRSKRSQREIQAGMMKMSRAESSP